jgi:hypothetical protein
MSYMKHWLIYEENSLQVTNKIKLPENRYQNATAKKL